WDKLFFLQAEDGIRDLIVTGVQTCALPIYDGSSSYTKASLTTTLAGLMSSAQASRVLTQDYLGTYGDGDHSDHHTVAYLVQAARSEERRVGKEWRAWGAADRSKEKEDEDRW